MSSKTLNERPNLQFWYQRRLLGFLKAGKYDQDILTCVTSLAGDDIKATARTVLPSMTVKANGWSLTSLPPNIVECLDDRLRELCPGGKQWRFGGMPPLERTKTEVEGYYYYPVGKPPVGADITTKLPCPAIPEDKAVFTQTIMRGNHIVALAGPSNRFKTQLAKALVYGFHGCFPNGIIRFLHPNEITGKPKHDMAGYTQMFPPNANMNVPTNMEDVVDLLYTGNENRDMLVVIDDLYSDFLNIISANQWNSIKQSLAHKNLRIIFVGGYDILHTKATVPLMRDAHTIVLCGPMPELRTIRSRLAEIGGHSDH